MEWVVIGAVIVVMALVFLMVSYVKVSERNRVRNDQWEEYSDALKENREADDLLNDPEYVKRLLKEDND